MPYKPHEGHDAKQCSRRAHTLRLNERIIKEAIKGEVPDGADALVAFIVSSLLEQSTTIEHYGSREEEKYFSAPEDSWVTRFTVVEVEGQEKAFIPGHYPQSGLLHFLSTPVDFCMKSGDKWPHW